MVCVLLPSVFLSYSANLRVATTDSLLRLSYNTRCKDHTLGCKGVVLEKMQSLPDYTMGGVHRFSRLEDRVLPK